MNRYGVMQPTSQPRVTVITVSYHSEKEVAELIATIRRGDTAPEEVGQGIEVVVVSNSADCGLLAALPKVEVENSGGNVGFARANRIGAGRARGEYLLFCNPDVRIEGSMIRAMADALAENPQYGTVSPFLSETVMMDRPDGTLHSRPGINIGACFMMRRDVYETIGGWDEGFFLWWEDTDLRDRVRDHGLEIGFVHNLVALHIGGHSTTPPGAQVRRLLTRVWVASHVRYLIKRRGAFTAGLWCAGAVVRNGVRVLMGQESGRAYAEPREAAGFAAQVLWNAWRMRRFVAFDGRGYVWEPDVERGLARPRAESPVGEMIGAIAA